MGNAAAPDAALPDAWDGTGMPAIGSRAQYFSETHAAWVECVVLGAHPGGALELSCKRGHFVPPAELATKLRPLAAASDADMTLGAGDSLEYYSDTHARWVPCRVLGMKLTGEAQLDVKQGYWMDRDEQRIKLRRPQPDRAPAAAAPPAAPPAEPGAPTERSPPGRLSASAVAAHDLRHGSAPGREGQHVADSALASEAFQSAGTWTPKVGGRSGDEVLAPVLRAASCGLDGSPATALGGASPVEDTPTTQVLEGSLWGALSSIFLDAGGSSPRAAPAPAPRPGTSGSLGTGPLAESGPVVQPRGDYNASLASMGSQGSVFASDYWSMQAMRSAAGDAPAWQHSDSAASRAALASISFASPLASGGGAADTVPGSAFASAASVGSTASAANVGRRPQGGRVGFDPGVEVMAFKSNCPAAKLQKHGRTFEGSFERKVQVPQTWSFATASSVTSSFAGVPATFAAGGASGPRLHSVAEHGEMLGRQGICSQGSPRW